MRKQGCGEIAALTRNICSLARSQVQVILVGITFFFAVFNFASSQDQGYGNDVEILTSRMGRGILHIASLGASYSFLLSALLTEKAGESFGSHFPRVAAMTQRIRGALRTKQLTRVAPIIRSGFMTIIAVCFITPVTGIVLYVRERSGCKQVAQFKAKQAQRWGERAKRAQRRNTRAKRTEGHAHARAKPAR